MFNAILDASLVKDLIKFVRLALRVKSSMKIKVFVRTARRAISSVAKL